MKVLKIINFIVLLPVRFYRKFISPLFPPSCRFTPTCSMYCILAVEEWGPIIGLGLAIWRILRCNPWSKGGFDPVPINKRRHKKENSYLEKENKNGKNF